MLLRKHGEFLTDTSEAGKRTVDAHFLQAKKILVDLDTVAFRGFA
jgi:hypothetical protein